MRSKSWLIFKASWHLVQFYIANAKCNMKLHHMWNLDEASSLAPPKAGHMILCHVFSDKNLSRLLTLQTWWLGTSELWRKLCWPSWLGLIERPSSFPKATCPWHLVCQNSLQLLAMWWQKLGCPWNCRGWGKGLDLIMSSHLLWGCWADTVCSLLHIHEDIFWPIAVDRSDSLTSNPSPQCTCPLGFRGQYLCICFGMGLTPEPKSRVLPMVIKVYS